MLIGAIRSRNKTKKPSTSALVSQNSTVSSHSQSLHSCPFNNGTHKLWNCPKFKSEIVAEHYETDKKLRLCFRILAGLHLISNCKSDRVCDVNVCTKAHNRLLHQTTGSRKTPVKSEMNASTKTTQIDNSGLLQLVKIKLKNEESGFSTEAVVLLDSGFTVSYIDKNLAEQLKCTSKRKLSMNVNEILRTAELDSQQVELFVGPLSQLKPTQLIFPFTHPKM